MTTPTAVRKPVATVRIARWSATHPWRAIALWLAFVIACVAAGSLSGLHTASDTAQLSGQSHTAAVWLDDSGLDAPDTENVLVTSRSGPLDVDAARRALAAAAARMSTLTPVAAVGPVLTSPDGTAMTLQVTLHHGADSDSDVTPLLAVTKAVQSRYPALRVEEVGSLSLDTGVNDQVASDLSAAATFSLPVTLLVLLIAFGAIVAAGVPLLLALSAVGAATGLASLASRVVAGAPTTSSMILLMGMAVGVDYSLFYVKRCRAERQRGHTQLDSVEIAAQTAGHSVLVSGLAVIVSMLGLFLADDVTFAALATGSVIVVAVAVLGSLTVLPAVLVKLGRLVDRPRVPVLWRLSAGTRQPRLWPALLRPALTRPGRTLTISVVALGLVALPALSMRLESDSARSLPSVIPAKQTFDRLTKAFPSNDDAQQVVVRSTPGEATAVHAALRELATTAADTRLFVRDSQPQLLVSRDRTTQLLTLDAPFDSESSQARSGLARLRTDLVPAAVHGIDDARWAVGGDTAQNVDTDNHIGDRLPWVIGFVVLLTMLIMGWVFRSVVIAVTTAAVNLLSAATSFGVLVLTFQHTWAQSLLDFRSTGALINWIPLFTFAVLFGLSMDYHVFVISQIREAAREGRSTRDAIRQGITRSAGTVTSAALVMVSVFAIFASLHMVEMKELGVGLAVAVLVDALVVRVIVLPSLMMLLGRWNWWPGRVPSAPVATVARPVTNAGLASVGR